MDHQFGALNMAQEFMAQADSFGCAFNQPWDIRHHESPAIRQVHNAKVWIQRGKMIVGNLRIRIGHPG